MRHGKKIHKLGRTSSHRKALLANMAVSLIMHKRIKTTLAKAKALRKYIEPLINKTKEDTTHSRRIVFSYLQNKEAVTELFREISGKVANRPGGYTRILKLGNRIGDAAEICYIELVDYNQNMLTATEEAKKKTTRRSRRKKALDTEQTQATAPKAKTEEKTKPVAEKTVVEETVAEKTVVEETVAEETVAEETVVEEMVAEKTVAEETVVEEMVAEETVAEETVVEETVVEEIVAEETVVEETVKPVEIPVEPEEEPQIIVQTDTTETKTKETTEEEAERKAASE